MASKNNTRQPNLFIEITKGLFREKVTLGLLFSIFASAFAVVMVTDASRAEVIKQDTLLQQKDELDLAWGYLVVESEFYAQHARVEDIAKKKLDMKRPERKDEKLVVLP
ncbi:MULTISPECIES: cell division protein FtsL [Pseudoalteromonas]|uniref:Cell division protein FtsL n=1 Tax=Pseudoalteromonas spongiae TaxID=298657 RepID=A0ABU8EN60_9GAMM|nr:MULTISPECIES: cell division protein FtsL [Pseudoalteromonas]TMO84026.1 cell division protein FtsL [Pseudoalteromonas spongiae]